MCVIRLTGGCARRQSVCGGLRNVASRLTARGDTWSDLGPVCGDGVTTTTGQRGSFCVWTSEIGSLVTPDLDVCVWVPGNQTGRTPHPRGDVNESPDDADVTVYQDPDWSST